MTDNKLQLELLEKFKRDGYKEIRVNQDCISLIGAGHGRNFRYLDTVFWKMRDDAFIGEYIDIEKVIDLYKTTNRTNNEAFHNSEKLQQLFTDSLELFEAKNKDYGNSFSESYHDFGAVAGLVRINDKVNRLNSLYKNKEQLVKDESFLDTLQDLLNYSAMLYVEVANDADEEADKTSVEEHI